MRQALSFVRPSYNFRRNPRSLWISHWASLSNQSLSSDAASKTLGHLSVVVPLSNLGGEISNNGKFMAVIQKSTKVSYPEPLLAHKENNVLRSTIGFNSSTPSTLTLTRSATGILTLSSAIACTLYVHHTHIYIYMYPHHSPVRDFPRPGKDGQDREAFRDIHVIFFFFLFLSHPNVLLQTKQDFITNKIFNCTSRTISWTSHYELTLDLATNQLLIYH